MAKTPEIVIHAKRGDLKFLEDFNNLPDHTGKEACLNEEPDLFFSEFGNDIAKAKAACVTCPMIQLCAEYAMKHENYGVWGGMSADERYEKRGNQDAFDPTDIERLLKEKNFILNSPAPTIAAHYEVDSRTVVRWRNIIRAAQEVG